MSKSKRITPEDVGVNLEDDTNVIEDQNTRVESKVEKDEPTYTKSQVMDIVNDIERKFEKKFEVLSMQVRNASPEVSMVELKAQAMQASVIQKKELVKILDKQDKVQLVIPMGFGEKPGSTHEVGINGVVFVYPKGKLITVPKTVANLLMDHFNITSDAGKEFRLDRDKSIEDALT